MWNFEMQDFKWLKKLFGVVVDFGTTQIWKKDGQHQNDRCFSEENRGEEI